MANTFVKISTVTVGAGGSSTISFTSIPQTYTDLKIVISGRTDFAAVASNNSISFNGSATSFSSKLLSGDGGSVASYTRTDNLNVFLIPGSSATASVFGNSEIYIPNYTSANNKSFYCDSTTENNATSSYTQLHTGLWSNTAAITSVTLTSQNGNFVQYSTATLYGVANVTATSSAYATGGNRIYTDGTYWYHQFLATGTTAFVPSRNLTVDYLVVAGGGGSAAPSNNDTSAGGGAGGVRCTVGATGGGGSLESPLSLIANTSYTVTVGAGGTGGVSGGDNGVSGSNSVFSTITSTGGGYSAFRAAGVTGGSGSGANGQGVNTAGSGTANQGYAGGTGTFNGSTGTSGGGGGAGQVGNTAGLGRGGNGITTSISGTSTTYGGGGGGASTAASQAGGTGGGGTGGYSTHNSGTNGTDNTGGGAGGAWAAAGQGASGKNGGSGIVIIRYAV